MGLFGEFPELEGLDPQQRKRLFRRACWRSLRQWQMWVALLLLGVGVVLVVSVLHRVAALWLPDRFWLQFILFFLAQSAAMFVFMWWNLRFAIRFVRAELPHTCVNCGYDLRASTDRCPECGTPIPSKDISPKSPIRP